MTNAGYEVAFIGKYHLSKGIDRVDGVHVWDDIERYEFKRWSPPDAGRNTALSDYGGGFADHDTRFVGDAIAYLEEKVNAQDVKEPYKQGAGQNGQAYKKVQVFESLSFVNQMFRIRRFECK